LYSWVNYFTSAIRSLHPQVTDLSIAKIVGGKQLCFSLSIAKPYRSLSKMSTFQVLQTKQPVSLSHKWRHNSMEKSIMWREKVFYVLCVW